MRLKPKLTRNIPVCTTLIFNSSALCEPSVMNGVNNSNEWKPLTRLEKRDCAEMIARIGALNFKSSRKVY